jgi:hypothetical protein
MSNFTAFNQSHIAKLINPFDIYIDFSTIPIKYEAITPDIFLFLFRNTGKDGLTHYFIAMEFDYISDTKEAEDIINNWYGKIIKFLPLYFREADDNPDFRTISAPTSYPYYAIMAEVEPPVPGSGFWGDNIIVKPGDNLDDKISQFTEKEQASIRKGLNKVLAHENKTEEKPKDGDGKDAETLKAEVSIYKNRKGGFEFFYNKDDFKNKRLEVEEVCRKLESTIKNNYADSIKDLAYSIESCLIICDDTEEECYKQYPILGKIANLCNEIETIKSVARQKKLLDEIKISVSMLRDILRRKSENIHS